MINPTQCKVCMQYFPIDTLYAHQLECNEYSQEFIQSTLFKCVYCAEYFPKEFEKEHIDNCDCRIQLNNELNQEGQKQPEFGKPELICRPLKESPQKIIPFPKSIYPQQPPRSIQQKAIQMPPKPYTASPSIQNPFMKPQVNLEEMNHQYQKTELIKAQELLVQQKEKQKNIKAEKHNVKKWDNIEGKDEVLKQLDQELTDVKQAIKQYKSKIAQHQKRINEYLEERRHQLKSPQQIQQQTGNLEQQLQEQKNFQLQNQGFDQLCKAINQQSFYKNQQLFSQQLLNQQMQQQQQQQSLKQIEQQQQVQQQQFVLYQQQQQQYQQQQQQQQQQKQPIPFTRLPPQFPGALLQKKIPQQNQQQSCQLQRGYNLSIEQPKKEANQLQENMEFHQMTFYNSPGLDEDHKTCMICYIEYQDNDVQLLLPCAHRFHITCAKTWLAKSKTCPYCNIEFK